MRENVLIEYARRRGIPVYDTDARICRSIALDCGHEKTAIGIADDPHMTAAERTTRLAHELGHCCMGAFYSRYTRVDTMERAEARATRWAIRSVLPRAKLRDAAARGITEPWEIAEVFGVTEDFVRQALDYYHACGTAE